MHLELVSFHCLVQQGDDLFREVEYSSAVSLRALWEEHDWLLDVLCIRELLEGTVVAGLTNVEDRRETDSQSM